MTASLLLECDVRVPVMRDGKKIREWRTKPVTAAKGADRADIRCKHCHGRVRIHEQKDPQGPADHVEHLDSDDTKHCRAGSNNATGTHRMSLTPVT